jgi:uncharacterized protein YjbJ (UPF0337 family)
MNEDTIKGKWKQLSGKIQAKWGKLTNDDIDVAEGNTEYLVGKIQERYGIAREEAEKQVRDFNGAGCHYFKLNASILQAQKDIGHFAKAIWVII